MQPLALSEDLNTLNNTSMGRIMERMKALDEWILSTQEECLISVFEYYRLHGGRTEFEGCLSQIRAGEK